MVLNKEDLSALTAVAIEAATKAGKYIAASMPSDIEYKQAGSSAASQVVTEVDRKSEQIILAILNDSLSKYDLGLLAEESVDDGSRLLKDYFWCIDPLDGTLPFIEGQLGSAVAISLISKYGDVHIGVVYEPRTSRCFSAYTGGGVLLNNEIYAVPASKNNYLTIIHHRSIMKQTNFNAIIDEIKLEHQLTETKYIHHGGAVMNAIWNIENAPSIYFAYPKKEEGGGCIWDYAATVCIYQELGLEVGDFYGNKLHLNAPNTIFMNKKGVRFKNL